MANYTKELWNDYNKNRKGASKETIKFVRGMFNNPTLKNRRNIKWCNYYMVTGYVTHDKDDFRRMATRLKHIDG